MVDAAVRDGLSGRRVVVTGGSGFIGTNLVEFLARAGAVVRSFDIDAPRNAKHAELWQSIDVRDGAMYVEATRRFEPELFFHLAARTDLDEEADLDAYDANVGGVVNTLRAVEGTPSVRRLVVTSSQLVCDPWYTPKGDTDYCPHTLYGRSKVRTEEFTRAWSNPSCPWVLVRPTSIWGPWFGPPYIDFFLSVAKRRYAHQRGVNPLRSFGYVSNVVHQYVKLALAPTEAIAGKTFYLADYEPVRVREFADRIAAEVGAQGLREVPLVLIKLGGVVGDLLKMLGMRAPPLTTFRVRNLTRDSVKDMKALEQIVGPLPVTISRGVDETVSWMREQRILP